MGTATADRAWQHRIGSVTIIPSVATGMNTKTFAELFPANTGYLAKLEAALRVAPRMVEAALNALDPWSRPTSSMDTWAAASDPATRSNPDVTEAGLALVKYFNLRLKIARAGQTADNPDYWRFRNGIVKVYEKIATGLAAPYEIVIGDFSANARVVSHGRVVTTPVSPIRQGFGFADEFGHTTYTWPERRGRMQVSHAYIINPATRPEDLARTIVHEASHKWAQTKDVLYKSQSMAKLGADLADDLEDLLPGVRQPGIQRASRPNKPLSVMAGANLKNFSIIDAERWLENADSYAWTARRLWKRAGR